MKSTPYILAPSFLYILFAFMLASCAEPGSDPAFASQAETQNLAVKYASGLRVQLLPDGYAVQVRNPQDTTEVLGNYHFSRRKKTAREGHKLVRIPVEKVALNSTTFVPYFAKMNAHERIVGVSYATRVSNEVVKAQVNSGQTLEIAGGDGIDLERLAMAGPDALMAYIFGEANFDRVEAQGTPVVLNMEYKETSPLGRAEWVKLIGCMLDRYEEAETLFDGIENYYNEVRDLAASAGKAPVVFSGSKYEKVWFTPGNKSFVAQFIRDAGGIYAFEHVEGQGNVEIDFEEVLSTINQADFWGLVVSSPVDFSLSALLKLSPDYALFKAFKEGQVFVCNTAKSDYFGEAVLEPQVILADLVSIIHPGLLPQHQHTYFSPVVVDVKS